MGGWVWWVRKGGAGWRGGGAGLEGERERGVRSAMVPVTPLSPDSDSGVRLEAIGFEPSRSRVSNPSSSNLNEGLILRF
jgi:hypothetical protein